MVAIKGLLTSKKFYLTILGTVIVTALQQLGAPLELLAIIGGLFGTNVVAQGIADKK